MDYWTHSRAFNPCSPCSFGCSVLHTLINTFNKKQRAIWPLTCLKQKTHNTTDSIVVCRIIQLCKYVPAGFGYSYIVPIAKSKDSVNKAVTYDDFRGIAISPILSKVFTCVSYAEAHNRYRLDVRMSVCHTLALYQNG